MEAEASALTVDMLVAAGVLVAIYTLIFSDIIHRTSAAVIGAVVMIIAGMLMGFYTQKAALLAIDANTILLLFGMMVVVEILRPTGGFEYAAIRMAKLARGSPRLLLVYLCLAVSVISMFLDNVTTIVIFAPLTLLITRILDINPMPYLVAEAMLSNVGGTATLVGDPPNIMIGSATDISFNEFLIHLGPPIAVVWLFSTALLLFIFRRQLVKGRRSQHIDLDEKRAIKDMPGLKRGLFGLALIIALFFTHRAFHVYPAFAVFIGLALMLALSRPKPEALLREVHWSLLLFFAGLFVVVGGVEASGLLALLGEELAVLADDPGQLLLTALVVMWSAALISAIVDNIPFTVTMIPILLGLERQGMDIMPLWWALALGVGLGGNGTHIGATANIFVVSELDECGIPEARVSPLQWLRMGLPIMLASLIVASILFVLLFDFLR